MLILLNIIGPGRVGRSLGHLLHHAGACAVQDVLSAEYATAQAAITFIGTGSAVRRLGDMRPAALWLLTPPDDAIASMAAALAAAGCVRQGDTVFHCSGAHSSALLQPLSATGARVASVHPLKTFAEPARAVTSFTGTWCTIEGDTAALALLRPLFEQLGARVVQIDAAGKTLYHAASVLVCNDLTALMEAGLRSYESAGLDRVTAQAMMEPLVRETLDNVLALGTVRALTGPVARGDAAVVARQLTALNALDPRIADAYRALNAIALDLARTQGSADTEALDAVAAALNSSSQKQQ
jgi:predicted short-subunit dehydrogenase-like oxidoreductase (DUF2520 family)